MSLSKGPRKAGKISRASAPGDPLLQRTNPRALHPISKNGASAPWKNGISAPWKSGALAPRKAGKSHGL